MPWIRALGVVCLVAIGACNDNDVPTTRRDIGYISVSAPVSGQQAATAEGIFFHDPGGIPLPNSGSALDSCEIRPFSASSNLLTPGAVTYLDAGDSITMQTDGAIGFLTPISLPDGTPAYALENAAGLPFTPGSTVTFAIPGAADAFATTTATGKMAEPYTLGPIDTVVGATEGLPISWSPRGDDSSRINLSLQYATAGSSSPNEQIFCSLRDDGADTVPANLLHAWRTATGPRPVDSFRWRSSIQGTRDAVLDVVTKYSVSKSTLP
jgi:hypothetical protein